MLELLSSVYLTLGRSLGITYHRSRWDVCLPANTIVDHHLRHHQARRCAFSAFKVKHALFSAVSEGTSTTEDANMRKTIVADTEERLWCKEAAFANIWRVNQEIRPYRSGIRLFSIFHKAFSCQRKQENNQKLIGEWPHTSRNGIHNSETARVFMSISSPLYSRYQHFRFLSKFSWFWLQCPIRRPFFDLKFKQKGIFVKTWQFSSLRLNLLTISRVQFQFLLNTMDLYGSNHFIRFHFISQRHQKKQSKQLNGRVDCAIFLV